MKSQNINRLSLGVQSFDDDILKKMGRVHSSKESLTAIEKIRDAGFDNLSIDLIYGFPGLTIEKWISTLKKVMSLDIDAYQLYRLRIIPHGDKSGSILSQNNKFPEIFPDFMQILLMKEFGILYSNQNGYTEMSRRLFCKSREYSSAYLKDHTDRLYDVIGIGLSSWINIQGIMAINTSESLKEYYSYIDAGKLPVNRGKIKTCDDYERWAIVLPLKHGGVSKKKFSELTKKKLDEIFKEKINRLKKHGLLTDNGDFISLTEKGAFFADEVCIQFYHPDYIPFPKSDYNSRELNPFNP
jgi:oxygen-independent coproporphyrinogen-3 oxidase